MTLHVHTARLQPATRFVDEVEPGHRVVFRHPPRRPLYAGCCHRKRIAANLNVQVYYDMIRVTCKPGKGCKGK